MTSSPVYEMSVERVDPRAPHRHLDRDAAPCQLVRALAADLHRRGGRDRQLDLAAEAREPLSPAPLRVGGSCRSTTLALGVAGRRARREVDVGDVALVEPDEAWREFGCRARTTAAAGRSRTGRACPRGRCARRSGGAGRRRSRTRTARPACRPGRSPAGLKRATDGTELPADEVRDLLDRRFAREPAAWR